MFFLTRYDHILMSPQMLVIRFPKSLILNEPYLSNFLQDFNAKLSDFGLARSGPTGDNTHVSTRVIGTRGYAAPEYIATG